MKRPLGAIAACVFAVVVGSSAVAAGGVDKYSFAGGSPDGGSCGNDWANDTYTLDITVRKTSATTFAVSVKYKDATFVTLAGQSPGACNTGSDDGSAIVAGIVGNFNGSLDETVTSSTYDPNGCVMNPGCSSRTGVITGLFGATAGQSDFTYNFEYSSSAKQLVDRHWQDKSDKSGSDKFVGDIATS